MRSEGGAGAITLHGIFIPSYLTYGFRVAKHSMPSSRLSAAPPGWGSLSELTFRLSNMRIAVRTVSLNTRRYNIRLRPCDRNCVFNTYMCCTNSLRQEDRRNARGSRRRWRKLRSPNIQDLTEMVDRRTRQTQRACNPEAREP